MELTERATESEGASASLPGPHRYLSFYGLGAAPFRASVDPRFLWLGQSHRATLATLTAAIRDGDGIFLLTGDVANGKTSLANRLAEVLAESGVLVGKVHRPGLDALDFFQGVLSAFGIARPIHAREDFVAAFRELLDGPGAGHKSVLLVVDEAQSLSLTLLHEIWELPALASGGPCRLAILLVGHTELHARLSEDRGSGRPRIAAACSVAPLTRDEVASYVRHALKMAGSDEDVFSAQAIGEIAAFSRGAPGAINIICDRALLLGEARGARPITRSIIEECCRRPGSPGAEKGRREMPRRVQLLGRGSRTALARTGLRLGLGALLVAIVFVVIGAQIVSPSWMARMWRDSATRAASRPSASPAPPPEAGPPAATTDVTEARPPVVQPPAPSPAAASLHASPLADAPRPDSSPVASPPGSSPLTDSSQPGASPAASPPIASSPATSPRAASSPVASFRARSAPVASPAAAPPPVTGAQAAVPPVAPSLGRPHAAAPASDQISPTLVPRAKPVRASEASRQDAARPERPPVPVLGPAPSPRSVETPAARRPSDRNQEARGEGPDPSAVIDWLMKESSKER